jgi:RNA polymerase sigma-70 factor (ECF subfamily)
MHPAVAVGREALEDTELVALAGRGDEGAVRALVRRYNQQLFRIARGVVRDDGEAEDVVQETYVRAFTRLREFRGEASFATWLTRIALNEALGRVRRRRPTADLSQLDAASHGGQVIMFPTSPAPSSPEHEAGREQIRRVLEQAVDELPDAFRIVFIMREIQGLSTEETAADLDIRPETVKTRLHRARKLLRKALERTFAGRFSDLFPFDGERCVAMADRVVARLRETGCL